MNNNDFDIQVVIEKNILKATIVIHENISLIKNNKLQYAFYLLKEGSKINTTLYSYSNTCEFNLYFDGKYNVVGFVRNGEDRILKKSDEYVFKFDVNYPSTNLEENILNLSIFGSCVSRDMLEFDRSKKIKLKSYIARQSLVSAVSLPVKINENDIRLESKFQKLSIVNDFKKETFTKLKADGSDYIIIDFIDERFKLAKVNDGNNILSYITYSSCLQESKYLSDSNFKLLDKEKNMVIRKSYFVEKNNLDLYLKEFCNRLLIIYKPENIIIHRAKMCSYYIDKNGKAKRFESNYIANNKKINELLDYMYDYLEVNIPNAKVIDLCDYYYADENHKWGLAPMHYEKEYYLKAVELILQLL